MENDLDMKVSCDADSFKRNCLEAHNTLRALHNAKPLCLNETLCEMAAKWTEECAKANSFRPRDVYFNGETIGENFAIQFINSKETDLANIDGAQVVQMWYNEIRNFKVKTFSPNTGHFTQVIWKDTTDVGFGRAVSQNGCWYMSAYYYPAGNAVDEFEQNVEL